MVRDHLLSSSGLQKYIFSCSSSSFIADIFFFVVYSCGSVVHIACVLALCLLVRQKLCFLVCSSINSWCWNTVAMSMSMSISRFNRSMAKS